MIGRDLISVIVPARDAARTLDACLTALNAQVCADPWEVIVVDDGSTDETPEIAAAYAPRVKVVRNEGRNGPGAARNRGVVAAHGSLLAFTDADCFPAPYWLERGRAALEGVDLVQGAVFPDPSVPRSPFDRTVEVTQDGGLYQTANLFVHRDLFDRVGGFRDWLHDSPRVQERRYSRDHRRQRATRTPIGEDTLFGWSARRLGASVLFQPDAVVYHEVVPGGIRDDAADRWHWSRDMAGLVREVPELREAAFYQRYFFHGRTARVDLALLSLAIALATRRRSLLIGTLPYLRFVIDEVRRRPVYKLRYGAAEVSGDIVTAAGLLAGSLAWRSPIL